MAITTVFPTGVATSGNEAVYFVPAIADTSAPKLTEITAGFNVHCATDTFSTSADQGTVSDVRLCSRDEYEQPGQTTYKINDIKYVYDPQKPEDTAMYGFYAAMTPGTRGYIVDRRGIDSNSAPASGQVVDVYPVTLGARSRVPITGGKNQAGNFQSEQKVFVTGPVKFDVKIAA